MAKAVAAKKKAAAPAKASARTAKPAARATSRPAPAPARRANVRPDPPRPARALEQTSTHRRAATAADVPGTSQHAERYARRQANVNAATKTGIKVRATKDGYYGHIRRRVGDVFVISSRDDYSEKWMEPANARERETLTLSNDVIRQKHDETLALKYGGRAIQGGQLEDGGGEDFDDGETDPLGADD